METQQRGDATEAAVIAELKRRGIPVSQPFGDNERYDILVETPDTRILRVQIKTGWIREGNIEFHGKSQHTNSQGNTYRKYEGDVDYFFVYVPERESLYVVGEWEFETSIQLRIEEPEQDHHTINWAADYEFETRWPPREDARELQRRTGLLDEVVAEFKKNDVAIARSVSVPDCDLLCEHGDEALHRISVHRGRMRNGCVTFTQQSSIDRSRVDWFAVYAPETETLYLVNDDEFANSISLRVDDDVQNRSTINWATDYELATRIENLR